MATTLSRAEHIIDVSARFKKDLCAAVRNKYGFLCTFFAKDIEVILDELSCEQGLAMYIALNHGVNFVDSYPDSSVLTRIADELYITSGLKEDHENYMDASNDDDYVC
jgi:hypothetical protein